MKLLKSFANWLKEIDVMILEGTFLKKDGPKIIALIQQAELLSSLALIVHTEKTEGSYENACKVKTFLFFNDNPF